MQRSTFTISTQLQLKLRVAPDRNVDRLNETRCKSCSGALVSAIAFQAEISCLSVVAS